VKILRYNPFLYQLFTVKEIHLLCCHPNVIVIMKLVHLCIAVVLSNFPHGWPLLLGYHVLSLEAVAWVPFMQHSC
jgi:hypothetical protein